MWLQTFKFKPFQNHKKIIFKTISIIKLRVQQNLCPLSPVIDRFPVECTAERQFFYLNLLIRCILV